MSISRIKVVAKHLHPNASFEERERNFRILLLTFQKAVNDSGLLTKFKEKQFYESKGEKRRRKAKEASMNKIRESFKASKESNYDVAKDNFV